MWENIRLRGLCGVLGWMDFYFGLASIDPVSLCI